eukprot:1161262-Pelagomonas_calceolata.AAC.5
MGRLSGRAVLVWQRQTQGGVQGMGACTEKEHEATFPNEAWSFILLPVFSAYVKKRKHRYQQGVCSDLAVFMLLVGKAAKGNGDAFSFANTWVSLLIVGGVMICRSKKGQDKRKSVEGQGAM